LRVSPATGDRSASRTIDFDLIEEHFDA